MDASDLTGVRLSPSLIVNLAAMHDDDLSIDQRLAAALSVSVNVDAYTAFLARLARASGRTWDDIAAPLHITRQTAYARYASKETTMINMLTGSHPTDSAMYYALDSDTPADWDWARSRDDCPAAYSSARERAEARARELGGDVLINDGGIDRGSGLFWDLYIASRAR